MPSFTSLIELSFIVGSLMGLLLLRRRGWTWAWARTTVSAGLGLAGVSLLALLGLVPGLLVLAALAMYVLFALGRLVGARKLSTAYIKGDMATARRIAAWLSPLQSKLERAFTADQIRAYEAELAGDAELASQALEGWIEHPDVPPLMRGVARLSRLKVLSNTGDWQTLVERAEATPRSALSPGEIALVAVALHNLGRHEEAVTWWEWLWSRPSATLLRDAFAIQAWAQVGALAELEAALARNRGSLFKLPAAQGEGFRAAALHRGGDVEGAHDALAAAEAAATTPALQGWVARLRTRLATLPPGGAASVSPDVLARLHGLMASPAVAGKPPVPPVLAGVLAFVLVLPVVMVLTLMGLMLTGAKLEGAWAWPMTMYMLSGSGATNAVTGAWTGSPWRLLYFQMVHFDPLRLALDVVAIGWAGRRLVPAFGPAGLLAAFMLGGVAGGALHLAAAPTQQLIGASAGASALLGMLAASWLRRPAPGRGGLARAGGLVVAELVYAPLIYQAAGWTALGGLLAGLVLGLLWPLGRSATARA